jgi:hypothetical protein
MRVDLRDLVRVIGKSDNSSVILSLSKDPVNKIIPY